MRFASQALQMHRFPCRFDGAQFSSVKTVLHTLQREEVFCSLKHEARKNYRPTVNDERYLSFP
jgi:hypothetical protein